MKSLKARLFIWYLGSLTFLAAFFYLAVHIFSLEYSNELFVVLFVLLALAGYLTILQVIQSILLLTNRMKVITSKNLDERITELASEDEIGELANQFNLLLERLSEAFRREKQFITDVAHEFKTPLTTLKSDFEITLGKERSVKEYKKVLADGVVEIDKISSTLNNVLDLARSNIPMHERIEKFNLSDVVIEVCDTLCKLANAKNIQVEDHIQPEIHLSGYRERVARALLNIADNAVKYTPPHGVILLTLTQDDNNAVITIKDSGVGIAKEDQERIFDRFYRSRQVENITGSGLGLSITKAIVTSHLGTISVVSEINKGTTFTITLPIKY